MKNQLTITPSDAPPLQLAAALAGVEMFLRTTSAPREEPQSSGWLATARKEAVEPEPSRLQEWDTPTL